LTREGRRNSFSNKEIKAFQRKHFSKKIEKKFLSNKKDQNQRWIKISKQTWKIFRALQLRLKCALKN